jgi:hypothetical protein
VRHAVVDGWTEGDCTVLVLRDLGDRVLSWEDRLSADQAQRAMAAVASLHRTFLGQAPQGLAPLDLVVTMFTPRRIREAQAAGLPLPEGARVDVPDLPGCEIGIGTPDQRPPC